jgi:hypothetical protein
MGLYILVLLGWSLVGTVIISALGVCDLSIVAYSYNSEFFNPIYCYKHARVNWFGAFMVALGFALLSPLWAAGFWFYKLCTVGRK